MSRGLILVLVLALAACSSTELPEPAPPPGDLDDSPPPARRKYIGDLTNMIFHRDGCPEIEKLDLSRQRCIERHAA